MTDENKIGDNDEISGLSKDASDLVFEITSLAIENNFPTREQVLGNITSRNLDKETTTIINILEKKGVFKNEGDKDNG